MASLTTLTSIGRRQALLEVDASVRSEIRVSTKASVSVISYTR